MTEPSGNQRKVQTLCESGGLQVTFETIATLHQCALFEEDTDGTDSPSASLHWEVLQYGIPVVIANENGVVLCLADLETGDKVCEFQVTTSSQYVMLDSHFHVLAVSCGFFGISFHDGAAAEKLMTLLKRVVPCVSEDVSPSPKQRRVEDEATEGDRVEMDGDMTDGLFHRRKSREKSPMKVRPMISDPKDFQHLSHVGPDAAIADLTKSMNWTDTLKRKERIVSKIFPSDVPLYGREVDTVSTSSFEAAPPGPPPPAPPPPPAVVAPQQKLS